VFTRGRSILAARFDPRRREVLGAPVAMQDDIRANQQVLLARSDLSASGSLVYAASIARAPRRLLWSDRAGRTEPLPAPPRAYMTPRLSHDGRRAALAVEGDVWLVEVERGGLTRLTQGPGEGPEARGTPIWSPDDRRIAYACGVPGGLQGVCSRAADGSGTEELLITRGQRRCDLGSWTPDGAALLFVEYSAETRHDVWSLALAGDRRLRPLLDSRYDERAPALSSDGRWLAYSSDESGRREVYARPFPGLGAKWVVSTGGGDDPVWSRDGRELFYRRGEETWAVSVRTRPEFKADVPRRLFRGRYLQYPNMPWTDFDVAADGRFLMLKLDGPDDAPLVMVVNWAEELKTRLPPP
jgi:serine/threonine-protein kinase